jgi:hypothetical protein
MKKKTLYLIALISLISLFSSAKRIKNTCDNTICCELIKSKATNEAELNFPSLGLFFFNN